VCCVVDDEIQSATTLGRLAYTMPSVVDIMGTKDWSAVSTHYLANQEADFKFEIKVANTAEATNTACDEDKTGPCTVSFNLEYTPLLFDVTPNQVYWDQEIDVLVNPMKAQSAITAEMDPVVFIKLDGTRCDSEGFIDYQTRFSSTFLMGGLKTRAGDQLPGKQEPEVRFRVGNAYKMESSKHCNFAGDDCWYVKTHPKIDSISAVDGYLTGGQTLTIGGWGLKAEKLEDVEVTVDGVACKVTSSTLESITCVTGAAAAVSVEGPQPGHHGLKQRIIDPEDPDKGPYWGMFTDEQHPVVETKLLTGFENSYGNYSRAAADAKGWFKAPETGRYKFHTSCYNYCRLYMDETKFAAPSADAVAWTTLANEGSNRGWRNYLLPPTMDPTTENTYVSDWISLEAGEYYQLKGEAMHWDGTDHWTVSVEFEKASTEGHHHSNKAVQRLQIENEIEFEKFNITVKNAHGGKYQMKFVNPLYDPNVRGS